MARKASSSSRKVSSSRSSSAASKHIKFSDKLTDSLQDITGMIDEHKGMIDAIQDILKQQLKDGDVLLTQGAGNVGLIASKIVNPIADNKKANGDKL